MRDGLTEFDNAITHDEGRGMSQQVRQDREDIEERDEDQGETRTRGSERQRETERADSFRLLGTGRHRERLRARGSERQIQRERETSS